MTVKTALRSTMVLLGVTTMSLSLAVTGTTPAAAKTKAAKVLTTTTYQKKHKVHVQGGWMYSTPQLTHKTHHLTKSLYTKFYATQQVKVRQANGKTATLNYLISQNGQLKGYVQRTNVRNQWGYGKYSVAAYRKNALMVLNKERVKRGLKPYKASTKLNKVAQYNSNRMPKLGKHFKPNLKHTPHAGWFYNDYFAPKANPIIHYQNGAQWGQGSMNAWMGLTDRWIDYGAKPYLFSKTHTHIGFGGTQRGQKIYMFVVVNHN
ncbi:CAP domain-containing protein [Levilactobacillus zymae]|uniref:CAP domain-containing protein n=1 Tax=Levilactobacillus zymae TaxID=267363 RepID=UPI0028B4F167|nr:CAP domain-containing protein [Levilactobacillus zymae]MDT6980567.1 CAP domain-containing protein [Levilactobacillus zymae]